MFSEVCEIHTSRHFAVGEQDWKVAFSRGLNLMPTHLTDNLTTYANV